MLTSTDKAVIRPILRSIGALAYLVDVDGASGFRYFAHNLADESALGIPVNGPIEGRRPEELFPTEHAERLNRHYRRCVAERRTIEFEGHVETPEGARWASHRLAPIFDLNGRIVRILGTVLDVSAQKRAEQALAASEARYHALYDDNPAKLMTLDFDGTILSVNRFGAHHGGYEPGELLQHSILEFVPAEDHPALLDFLGRMRDRPDALAHIELRLRSRDGALLWVNAHGRVARDADGRAAILAVGEDVTEAHALREHLAHQALHDALTGLPNRRAFERRLEALVASATAGRRHVLGYLDLDRFRLVNDTSGHPAGDELLRQLGQWLAARTPAPGLVARLGGDEFGILYEDSAIAPALAHAEGLCRGLEAYEFYWEAQRFHLGASIGLVPIAPESGGAKYVLSAADVACYTAKNSGRGRVHVYQPDDAELRARSLEMGWANRFKQAMADGRLALHAQPIVPAAAGGAGHRHCELLVRLRDEHGAWIAAEQFLPAVERYGLTPQLDRWVVRHALEWLAREAPRRERLAWCTVNLSGLSLSDESFLAEVLAELDRTGVPADRFGFEITETAAITNLSRAQRFIDALKSRGCRFALDDFGTGLSSFGYLKNLPVDLVKIAGTFVRDVADNSIHREMVRAIVDICRLMGKQTVAEAVESDAVGAVLRELGVDYLQGHVVGAPAPLDELR
jgi:diguanylate cyclase (GGDEF)-like protein/PAS domain S-box-containing protein